MNTNKSQQTERRFTHVSKFLSLVLRHKPETIGVELDAAGWIDVTKLLIACDTNGERILREELDAVVAGSDKQRFIFSDDGSRIRANQGHSVPVELGYEPAEPPELLYHGTPERFVESIRREGLTPQKRHHVHLSENIAQTLAVGARRGKPVLLTVRAGKMRQEGHTFYKTPNNVWLTDAVPSRFISFSCDESSSCTP